MEFCRETFWDVLSGKQDVDIDPAFIALVEFWLTNYSSFQHNHYYYHHCRNLHRRSLLRS